jgi:hypothetical protein
MRYAYPPYDFIIIGCLTYLIGFILHKTLFKRIQFNSKHYLVPYAIAFLFVSVVFYLIVKDPPLKFYVLYDNDGVYDRESQMGPNPQVAPGVVRFYVQYGLSILFDFLLAGYSLFIITRYFLSLKREAK